MTFFELFAGKFYFLRKLVGGVLLPGVQFFIASSTASHVMYVSFICTVVFANLMHVVYFLTGVKSSYFPLFCYVHAFSVCVLSWTRIPLSPSLMMLLAFRLHCIHERISNKHGALVKKQLLGEREALGENLP
jgi:hypothetical protein